MKAHLSSRGYRLCLGAALVQICGLLACAIPTGPAAGKTQIQIVSGNNQIGIFGETLPEPIVVRITVGGKPAKGVWVNWWVILPRVGPHTLSDLCGYAWNGESGNGTTFTDENGRSSIQWHGRVAQEPVEPQDCSMRVQVRNGEWDRVVAEDTVYARWESGAS